MPETRKKSIESKPGKRTNTREKIENRNFQTAKGTLIWVQLRL